MKHTVTLTEDEMKTLICKYVPSTTPEKIVFHCKLKKSDNKCVDIWTTCEWEDKLDERVDNS